MAEDPYGIAVEAGIHPLVLDTPFGVGPVNTYLIEDDPLTLVDCGPNTGTGLSRLEALLDERGHRVSDLGLLIVTHQHVDHTGLAGVIAARTGAEVACLDHLAPALETWTDHARASDNDAFQLMLRHGVEQHVAEALRSVATIVRGYGGPAPVGRPLSHGTTLTLAHRRFSILHRPGHSPSDIVLLDRERGIAVVGDHLLAQVSSNALIERPLGPWDGSRPEPLIQYRASLQATRELDIEIALTGHGQPVFNHRELITERLVAQEERAEHFFTSLADGPRSAHEIAVQRWGRVAVTQAYLTLSEVLGHLGLLIADGRVLEDRSEDVIRFERVS